ncbi:MAG: TIM barrel protein [Alphaproteobacteria bacterium]|nr:TIM barrel protein [Alphaproteobacteria bacterium]
MKKFGVKLWSRDFAKNPEFANQSVAAVKEGYFDYIELFVLPDSYNEFYQKIADEFKGIKVLIHAPHSVFGLDTGNEERFAQNCEDLKASQQYADLLHSEIIILHPGFNAQEKYLAETIRQFTAINDSRLTVENLPYLCTATGKYLHGTSPQQIKQIMDESGCRFCLDFSHAICAANSYKRDKIADLRAYQELKPVMYHLCDGDWSSSRDEHRHYGEGNYPLAKLLNEYTDDNTYITMETGMTKPTVIQPWLDDIRYLKSLLKNII